MGQNASYDSNFITYAGAIFFVGVTMFYDDPSDMKTFMRVLEMQNIASIQYESALNDFLMRGKIVYNDQFSLIDRFIEGQNVKCNVVIAQMLKRSDAGIDTVNMSDIRKNAEAFIEHEFIVERIRPVNRNADVISYEIDLVSSLWKNCSANIVYSTFNDEPKSALHILKACMKNAGLAVDEQSFDNAQSNVKIDFMTQANDNIFSVFSYIADKMYFFESKEQSVKFLAYDALQKKYKIVDLSMMNDSQATPALMTFFKSSAEGLLSQKAINIGSYVDGVPHTSGIASMVDRSMFTYDFKSNSLSNCIHTSIDSTRMYMNSTSLQDSGHYQTKYTDIKDEIKQSSSNIEEDGVPDLKHFKSSSFWSTSESQQQKIVDTLLYDNSIVLDMDIDMRRQPGTCVAVKVDRQLGFLPSDSMKDLKEMMAKYKVFENAWIVSKVITTIRPDKQTLTQKAALFRNFAVKFDDQQ